jgi:hypothetical protein
MIHERNQSQLFGPFRQSSVYNLLLMTIVEDVPIGTKREWLDGI